MPTSSGVSPAIDAPSASESAPAAIRASATSESALLAAQWSGVCACRVPATRAFGSAPAAASTATTAAPLGKWPG